MNAKTLAFSNQDLTNKIRDFTTKNKILYNEKFLKTITTDDQKLIDKSLKEAPINSHIFVDNIGALGHSSFYILNRIKELKSKRITLHILNKGLTLHLGNELLFQVLESLLDFEISKIEHRTLTAKATREKKNTKLGRKVGQPVKSKYDKHKKRIMHLNKQGVPNTRIVKEIEMGTPQSLGKYIKQVKLEEKRKQQKKGTYMVDEEDLKNINKFGV